MYKHTMPKIESGDQRQRAAKTQRSDESENARERVLALARCRGELREHLESGPAAKGTRGVEETSFLNVTSRRKRAHYLMDRITGDRLRRCKNRPEDGWPDT